MDTVAKALETHAQFAKKYYFTSYSWNLSVKNCGKYIAEFDAMKRRADKNELLPVEKILMENSRCR